MPPDALGAVALAALCVLAGCGAFVGPETETSTTTTPAEPTATPTTTSRPIGLTAGGVTDALNLSRAHARNLGRSSYTVRTVERYYAPNGTLLARYRADRRVADRRFALQENRSGPREVITGILLPENATVYSNGTHVFTRVVRDGRPRYEARPAGQSIFGPVTTHGRDLVYQVFAASDTEIADVVSRNGTTRYRVEGTGGPVELELERATNLSVTASIARSGVVRELDLAYDAQVGNRSVRVDRTVTYFRLGGTTVERPAWVDRAAANATATANESTGGA